MVSSAGMVIARPDPVPDADSTAENILTCVYHLRPTNSVAPSGDLFNGALGWLGDVYPYPIHNSWVNDFPMWTPDRRPMMTIQLGSGDWAENPNGNNSEWYIPHYANGGTTILADSPEDSRSPNPDNSSDTVWVQGPNGVPDQFDSLIRTLKRWREYGVRRVLLHLPAGVIGGKVSGYADGHDDDPNYAIYGGTTQSMNQFYGMPDWKQRYFRGEDLQFPNHPPQNAWSVFMAAYPSDPMDIEVYVGGGIGKNTQGLGTEATVVTGSQPTKISSFDRFIGTPPNQIALYNDFWATPYGSNPGETAEPPYPIDPRATLPNGLSMKANFDRFWRFTKPWYEECGIMRLWLDTASENIPLSSKRWGSLEVSHNPYLTSLGVHIGGETIPTIDIGIPPNTVEILDDCAISFMPWFANFEVVSAEDNATTHHRTWKTYAQTSLSRLNTEVHLLDNTGHMDWDQYKYAREHGYVVGAYNAYATTGIKAAELMKRWYSMGWIQIADFNGDGVVNSTDLSMGQAAILYGRTHNNVWPIVYGNGDIDGDGDIDEFDNTYFTSYYYLNPTYKKDFGTPPVPAL